MMDLYLMDTKLLTKLRWGVTLKFIKLIPHPTANTKGLRFQASWEAHVSSLSFARDNLITKSLFIQRPCIVLINYLSYFIPKFFFSLCKQSASNFIGLNRAVCISRIAQLYRKFQLHSQLTQNVITWSKMTTICKLINPTWTTFSVSRFSEWCNKCWTR